MQVVQRHGRDRYSGGVDNHNVAGDDSNRNRGGGNRKAAVAQGGDDHRGGAGVDRVDGDGGGEVANLLLHLNTTGVELESNLSGISRNGEGALGLHEVEG